MAECRRDASAAFDCGKFPNGDVKPSLQETRAVGEILRTCMERRALNLATGDFHESKSQRSSISSSDQGVGRRKWRNPLQQRRLGVQSTDHFRTNLAVLKSPPIQRMNVALLRLTLLFWTGEAAECTAAEGASTTSIWVAAAATSACSPRSRLRQCAVHCYRLCQCRRGVANDLPDCTFNGLNHKIQVQNALTACIGGEIEDAGSLTAATDAPTATDSSTVSPSTSSASSSALTPEATTIAMDADHQPVEPVRRDATSEECASDSVVNGGNIEIIAQCNTNCMEAIRGLADELPDCFYDYEYINKKQYVLDQLDGCDGSATTINISLLPDNAVDYSSSSGFGSAAGFSSSSGSNALMAGDSASGSEQLNSENNPSDNTLGSSSGKSGSNASPPRGGKVLSWVSLMAVVVAAFMS
ncbi:hypothetical protein GQ600_27892 [Phytophthora cactorum]|nr:hypothetical protein GQ600_27892 [Phytophthora cactorum]